MSWHSVAEVTRAHVTEAYLTRANGMFSGSRLQERLEPVTGLEPEILQSPILGLSWLDLVAASGLVLLAVGLSRWQRLGLTGSLIAGAIRSVVQLALVGYVLIYIFAIDQWWLVLGALVVMLAVASREAVRRQEERPLRLYGMTGLALLVGSGFTLFYVSLLVVRIEPWYNPRYLIPLFGMIVGNAMNAAALAHERLAAELRSRRGEVEAYLALGATAARASRGPTRSALRAALIPTVNSLMVVGLVALPGMMTGQILAGVSPLLAIRYQIVVMFMLASAVSVSAVIVVLWNRRLFFTPDEQLRLGSGPV
jgi:putative ABC transport system permease protein